MSKRNLVRLLVVLLRLTWFVAGPPAHQAQKSRSATSFDKLVLPFVTGNCLYCHNAKRQSGGLNFELHKSADSIVRNREVWERVLQKLQMGEMPPEGAPRPYHQPCFPTRSIPPLNERNRQ